tara:strand:+ start:37436 stop:37564 length:129 start_codon:yes stop_codon:yes gene_type:complete
MAENPETKNRYGNRKSRPEKTKPPAGLLADKGQCPNESARRV